MKIFISYARENSTIVSQLPDLLSLHEIWYDKKLHLGDEWKERVGEKIEWCDCVLFVMSQYSIESEPCMWELDYAENLNRKIVSINTGDVPDYLIPQKLKNTHFIKVPNGELSQPTADLVNGLFRLELDTPMMRIKRLILDEKSQIELEDILTQSVKKSFDLSLTMEFDRQVREILRNYETNNGAIWNRIFELSLKNTQQTLELFACLTWYGKPEQAKYLQDAVVKWSKIPNTSLGKNVWQLLPTVLLIYVCGTLAIYRKKWDYIQALITEPIVDNDDPPSQKTTYILERLMRTVYSKLGNTNQMNGGGSLVVALENTGMTDLVKPLIRGLIGKYIENREEVDKAIDLFEMWIVLEVLKVTKKRLFHVIPSGSHEYIQGFWETVGRQGSQWQPIKIGFDTVNDMLNRLHTYEKSYPHSIHGCRLVYTNALPDDDLFNR